TLITKDDNITSALAEPGATRLLCPREAQKHSISYRNRPVRRAHPFDDHDRLWLHDALMGTGIHTVLGRQILQCPDCHPTTLFRQPVYGGSIDRRLPEGPFVRQVCARFASSTHDRPEMWSPAHA